MRRGRVTIRAVPVATPPRIDGQLDESWYGSTPSLSDFIQNEPTVDAPATEKTEVWVGYDSANVYVTVRAWESEPDRMVVNRDAARQPEHLAERECLVHVRHLL